MKFLSADYIFPVSSAPMKNAVLVLEEDGTVLDLLAGKEQISSDASVELHRGIICPGFVNAHCHLELSYLKGKIPEGKGLSGFIQDLIAVRNNSDQCLIEAAQQADAEMLAQGIVAIGDISNTELTIPVKVKSRIHYHSFIEIFDLNPDRAEDTFVKGKALLGKYLAANLAASIVPHAPYSVSSKLMKMIGAFAYEQDSLLSIHNQETEGENEMFLEGRGKFMDELNKISGAFHNWKATGFRSLPSVLVDLPKCNKVQLIHNTFSTAADIQWAQLYNLLVWWCFCPNANWYIERKLPDIPSFIKENAKMTVGTDSYASNNSLSILSELLTIQEHFPAIALEDSIRWATLNGAEFLGLHRIHGSFEKGKKPGINLILEVDIESLKLRKTSSVVPLS